MPKLPLFVFSPPSPTPPPPYRTPPPIPSPHTPSTAEALPRDDAVTVIHIALLSGLGVLCLCIFGCGLFWCGYALWALFGKKNRFEYISGGDRTRDQRLKRPSL